MYQYALVTPGVVPTPGFIVHRATFVACVQAISRHEEHMCVPTAAQSVRTTRTGVT